MASRSSTTRTFTSTMRSRCSTPRSASISAEPLRMLIFIHAGVVAQDGVAIALPGVSFAGKTTLVSALVRAGAVYYSDEFAVIDKRGVVNPYPKALSVRAGPGGWASRSINPWRARAARRGGPRPPRPHRDDALPAGGGVDAHARLGGAPARLPCSQCRPRPRAF